MWDIWLIGHDKICDNICYTGLGDLKLKNQVTFEIRPLRNKVSFQICAPIERAMNLPIDRFLESSEKFSNVRTRNGLILRRVEWESFGPI